MTHSSNKSTPSRWKTYQDDVVQVFRNLGLSAEEEVTVQGARARHRVDVLVTFERWGFTHQWIVECKSHKRPIEKHDVEALKAIASDVGAHCAFLVADSGFQPGAAASAKLTNVVLTTLTDLRTRTQGDMNRIALDELEALAFDLGERIHSFYEWTDEIKDPNSDNWTVTGRLITGIDLQLNVRHSGAVYMIRDAINRARLRKFPVLVPDFDSPRHCRLAGDPEELLAVISPMLQEARAWVENQERHLAKAHNS